MVRLDMLRLESKEGGPAPGKEYSVTFWRLHVPFLYGEADVD